MLRPSSARTANRTVDPGASPAIRAVVAGAVTAATRRAARPVHMSTAYLVAPPAPVHDTSTVVADTAVTVTAVGIATPAANVPWMVAELLPVAFQASSRQLCVDRGTRPVSVAVVVAAS